MWRPCFVFLLWVGLTFGLVIQGAVSSIAAPVSSFIRLPRANDETFGSNDEIEGTNDETSVSIVLINTLTLPFTKSNLNAENSSRPQPGTSLILTYLADHPPSTLMIWPVM